MKLNLSERAKECAERSQEMKQEIDDLNQIVMCIRALQADEANPNKFNYDPKDYDGVLERLRSLCAKHELRLPDSDYIEWRSIEII